MRHSSCHLGCSISLAQWMVYQMGVQIPHGKGQLFSWGMGYVFPYDIPIMRHFPEWLWISCYSSPPPSRSLHLTLNCDVLFRVVVSVLSVADTDCRLIEIGNVAQATGGHVCDIFIVFTKYIQISFTLHLHFYIVMQIQCACSEHAANDFMTIDVDVCCHNIGFCHAALC